MSTPPRSIPDIISTGARRNLEPLAEADLCASLISFHFMGPRVPRWSFSKLMTGVRLPWTKQESGRRLSGLVRRGE